MFYNFPFVQTRLYFTLADVIVLRDDEDPIMYETFTYPQYNHGAYGALCAAGLHVRDTAITNTLFQDYIWPEYYQSNVLYVDTNMPEEEITFMDIRDAWNKKCGHIFRWLNESTEKYSVLIDNLNQIKSKLMAQVQSTTTSDNDVLALFNDTPQAGGDFTGDDYVTNASKNTSSSSTTIATDAATPIARLKEVQDKLDSLYGRWADEFSRFVLH